jgi:hypothetical protein
MSVQKATIKDPNLQSLIIYKQKALSTSIIFSLQPCALTVRNMKATRHAADEVEKLHNNLAENLKGL